MLVEMSCPAVVGGKMSLEQALLFHAVAAGVPVDQLGTLVGIVPDDILRAECFFDLISNLWRYEYGMPWGLGQQAILGPHVWQPVQNLVEVVRVASHRLGASERHRYMTRLADPHNHEAVLAEFIPIVRLSEDVQCDFEHKTGVGDRDVDWRLQRPGHRPVLLDVKRRIADILATMGKVAAGERGPGGVAPQPDHDVSVLFRSIERKYAPMDPDIQLQGGWICSALKQESGELRAAFDELDGHRVHFAILGGWQRGVDVLARRRVDVATLLSVFDEKLLPEGYEFDRAEDESGDAPDDDGDVG